MKAYCIYMHRNKVDGKIYIGKTCQEPLKRFGSNGVGYRQCDHFYNAIKKYGWNQFEHLILCEGLTLQEANKKETELIQQYHSTDPSVGYNIRYGGDGFDSKRSKELWSDPVYRENISVKNVEMWKDEEYKKMRSEKFREGWKDPDKRARRSVAAKARWADKSFHAKAQQAVREACKTPVRCIETGEVFECMKDAEGRYGINHSNICKAIRQGTRSGGVHWERV